DLPRHTQLRERPERRLLVRPEVPHRLVQTDEAFLDQVLRVAAGEEVRARLHPDERRVAANQLVERGARAVARLEDELEILKLSLSLLRRLVSGCGADGHGGYPRGLQSFSGERFRPAPPNPHP